MPLANTPKQSGLSPEIRREETKVFAMLFVVFASYVLATRGLFDLSPPAHSSVYYVQVGLASVGNDTVKYAAHSLSDIDNQGTVLCFCF